MATSEGQAMGNMEDLVKSLPQIEKERMDKVLAMQSPAPSEAPMHYPVSEADAKRLENDFTFHTVKGDQAHRYGEIRETQRRFAALILSSVPPSRERSVALTKLEEVGFW